MKIIKIEIFKVALPLVSAFSTGFGRITNKPNIITRLTTDEGLVGYGEGPALSDPIYTPETADTCMLTLEKHLAPRVLGKSYSDPGQFVKSYRDIVGNNIAKSSIELAFWDLYAQNAKLSLKTLLKGTKQEIPVGESIGIVDNQKSLIASIEDYLDRGFVRIKLKITPGWDKEPLEIIRNKWPDIDLSADANASYSSKKHLSLLKELDTFNLTMLEQPFAIDDFIGHSKLQSELKLPICLDESICSLNDAETAIALQSCRIINIKPGRVGGLLEAVAIHDYAEKNNVGVWCGGMLETGIGRAFNLALASKENFVYPSDMSPINTYFEDDLTTPPLELTSRGSILISNKIGLGYKVNCDKLEKYCLEKKTLSARY